MRVPVMSSRLMVSLTLVVMAATMLPFGPVAKADDLNAALHKANLYIEVAKYTERAAESWERYISWVNVKTGPTGNERHISYGLYEVHDMSGAIAEARKAAELAPDTPKLEAAMERYIQAYERVAPVLNEAAAYYDRQAYRDDAMAQGKALHARLVPLAEAFLPEREAMLAELRPFVRSVEAQEVAAREAREGRSTAWHAASVMHAASRVVDTFPRVRPKPINSDAIDEMLKMIGPETSGEKFEELMSGVERPTGIVIDMVSFDAAMNDYAAAVDAFDRFVADKPDGLEKFKAMPRQFLDALRELQAPLSRNQGRDFEGSAPLVGQVINGYFAMISESSSLANSQLRFLQ